LQTNDKSPLTQIDNMNVIAFDPGQKGGIAIHHQGITTAYPMPLAGKVLDLATIATIIKKASPDIAVIEKVGSMPGQGVASTFHLALVTVSFRGF
jgi:crossover junction endodeoxyribonuclease RuvC